MSFKKYIASPTRTKEILSTYEFVFKKSLGQNFIIDANVLKNMIHYANIHEHSGVIEVGPGIGALTEQLAIHAKKVVAYEVDQRLLPILQDTLQAYNNIHIIHQDILQANLHADIKVHFSNIEDIHIVANLPYYITSPIMMSLLQAKLPVKNMTMMLQKEVAERIIAHPNNKDYGSLSVIVQYFSDVEKVMQISPHVFLPQPKVDSSILKLTLRNEPPVQVSNESYFFSFVRACFANRRKTLRNNLRSYFKKLLTKTTIDHILKTTGIDGQRRGESLTINDFAQLANAFYAVTKTS